MKSRLTLYMTIAVLVGAAIILAMNAASTLGIAPAYQYLSPNHVRGMAIEHEQKLYTLNFEQQNFLIDLFNRSTLADQKEVQKASNTGFSKIIVYRFNTSELEIQPTGFTSDNRFIFSTPFWNSGHYLIGSSPEDLKQFFEKTYDKSSHVSLSQ